ncbi:hypothetical protein BDP27DRAFT_1340519 [Rhodocollybia butyracea]|uniref:Uncharacterized protein n=1 Tax=Rhodocollybia butyracea TaxID=206335 RepID=A0A9P5TXW4_9AGAR|nr:hypothetical protein BDP27DRAFT_1340519 [Rhodocollybia butyracea]
MQCRAPMEAPLTVILEGMRELSLATTEGDCGCRGAGRRLQRRRDGIEKWVERSMCLAISMFAHMSGYGRLSSSISNAYLSLLESSYISAPSSFACLYLCQRTLNPRMSHASKAYPPPTSRSNHHVIPPISQTLSVLANSPNLSRCTLAPCTIPHFTLPNDNLPV